MTEISPYRGSPQVVLACKSCQFRDLAASRRSERMKDFWQLTRRALAVPYRHGPFVGIISYLTAQWISTNPNTPGIWAGLSVLGVFVGIVGSLAIMIAFIYRMVCAFARLAEDDLTDQELLELYAFQRDTAEKKVLPPGETSR